MSVDVFHQTALVLAMAVVLAIAASQLRQPLLVAFIAAGVLVGPDALGVVSDAESMELLAEIGVAVLLFIVGLKLDLHLVRNLGPVALAAGLGQVFFTSGIGYLMAWALGFDTVEALYVAVTLTFSSTIIVVKLLSDRGEIDELHGRIALGFLIVQDIIVIVVMIAVTAFGDPDVDGVAGQAVSVVVKGAGFLAGISVAMRWILPWLVHRLAPSPELLILFSVTWAVGLAATGDLLGFSSEVGAFAAGLTLAATPYREAIGARLASLRDFLLLFFFLHLGMGFDLSDAATHVGPALLFAVFVLVGKPVLVMAIMGAMGYRRRTSFLSGVAVAQISEFSLILGALGVSLGHIDEDMMGLITTVGLVTISLSAYVIYYSHPVFDRIGPRLGIFERRTPSEADEDERGLRPRVVVIGLGRLGGTLVEHLHARSVDVLGVDLDPERLRSWSDRGVPTWYGDAEDPGLPHRLPLSDAAWVIGSLRSTDANMVLISSLRDSGYRGQIAVAANTRDEADRLEHEGADRVLLPFLHVAEMHLDELTPKS